MQFHDLTSHIAENLDEYLLELIFDFIYYKNVHTYEKYTALKEAAIATAAETNVVHLDITRRIILLPNTSVKSTEEEVVYELMKSLEDVKEFILSVSSLDHSLRQPVPGDVNRAYDFGFKLLMHAVEIGGYLYLCREYKLAEEYLELYLNFFKPIGNKNYTQALWNIFSSTIMISISDDEHDDPPAEWYKPIHYLSLLNNYILNQLPEEQVQNKIKYQIYLLHWSLFIFFSRITSTDLMFYLFIHEKSYLDIIEHSCPHIIRYVVAAAIMNPDCRLCLSYIIPMYKRGCVYRDPITDFVLSLYVKYDLTLVRIYLRKCERVISSDYFLCKYKDQFMSNARHMIFECCCLNQDYIPIKSLAKVMGLEFNEAVEFIKDVIANEFSNYVKLEDSQLVNSSAFPPKPILNIKKYSKKQLDQQYC